MKYNHIVYCIKMDRSNHSRDHEDSRNDEKGKKGKQEFKCGESKCQKLYHSYTAFYNHCKKAHNGEFPQGSQLNNQLFDGPTKNRGRPRIKKNEVKNEFQIESMKAQNELIEFMGTIKANVNRGNEELISYVEDPVERINEAIDNVKQWRQETPASNNYLTQIVRINSVICQNDLPEFYDPIQYEKYQNNVDSYNFNSIYNFFKKKNIIPDRAQILLICWLARILSLKLLSQTIYVFLQRNQSGDVVEQKELFEGKSKRFFQLVDSYLELIRGEYNEENSKE